MDIAGFESADWIISFVVPRCRKAREKPELAVPLSPNVYVDATGKPMLKGGGVQVLVGNRRWIGPGGESLYVGADQTIMVFHAYDATTGKPALQVSTVAWNDGWPEVGIQIDSAQDK
jgi:hypothetical protein